MEKGSVPQDASPTYGGLRKLLYAVDERGEYTGVPSSGWEVESFSTELAVAELERQRMEAWQRAHAGDTSALEYHMFARRMDFDTLASVSSVWRWRLRRHLRPQVFARLPDKLLRRYADAMGITVAELRQVPAGTVTAFEHKQAAHCESGVVSALLTHYGTPLSEPMAFGLASALAFAYIPFIKMAGMPLVSYRMWPGAIVKAMQKRLGIQMHRQTFGSAAAGEAALDAELDRGRVVGLQTCIYWLPYVPDQFRFHFNMHNLIVYGREGDDYLVSDPLFEITTRCSRAAMSKARFAKGAMAAKGLMYFPVGGGENIDLPKLIPQAIRANYRNMMQPLFPVIGIRGIRYLGRKIRQLEKRRDRDHYLPLYLTHIVRMQEEIGSGGAGFRFIYASFLQESAKLLDSGLLADASKQLTLAGDEWRRFALRATKMVRKREPLDLNALGNVLDGCAEREAAVWRQLKTI